MNFLLLGRPNVGKTSIYNTLVGKHNNIIHPDSGTTRDWHQGEIKKSLGMFIYDTPGLEISKNISKIYKNNYIYNFLFKKIDCFLYVIDYFSIFNSYDREYINKLRKFDKQIILLINKFDNFSDTKNNEYTKYGLHNVFFLSCSHKLGFKILNEFFLNNYKNTNDKNFNHEYSISIFGKPNVGKSTLLNSFLDYPRALESSQPGTTTDYVEDIFIYKRKKIKIIDTAGIIKKSKISKQSLNYLSVKKSFTKISSVDVAIIVIDSINGLDMQDKRIIKLITNKSKKIIIAFNKIDLIKDKKLFIKETLEEIKFTLHEIKNIKVFFLSSIKKNNSKQILNYIINNVMIPNKDISTSKLNNWLKIVTKETTHPLINNKKVKFKYAVKIKNEPVTIKVFCNFSKNIRENYRKYLINSFNTKFKIKNQVTRFVFSTSENPYK